MVSFEQSTDTEQEIAKALTSTGLRKVTVRSTGPAESTKILWVEVN